MVKKFIRNHWLAVSILTVLFSVGIYTQLTPDKPVEVKSDSISVQEKPATIPELLELVNAERAKANVAPLVLDERLNRSAQMQCDDMVDNNYYDHVNPKTGKHGYEYALESFKDAKKVSENMVGSNGGAEVAVQKWVSSKTHYDAMVWPTYEITGFGICRVSLYDGITIVQHFIDL